MITAKKAKELAEKADEIYTVDSQLKVAQIIQSHINLAFCNTSFRLKGSALKKVYSALAKKGYTVFVGNGFNTDYIMSTNKKAKVRKQKILNELYYQVDVEWQMGIAENLVELESKIMDYISFKYGLNLNKVYQIYEGEPI